MKKGNQTNAGRKEPRARAQAQRDTRETERDGEGELGRRVTQPEGKAQPQEAGEKQSPGLVLEGQRLQG